MNKTELIRTLAERTGVSRAVATQMIEALFDAPTGIIPRALVDGQAVAIRGFGTFELRARRPRLARNPSTGAPVQLEARLKPVWRVARALEAQVNG